MEGREASTAPELVISERPSQPADRTPGQGRAVTRASSWQKEQLSRAYLHALASATALTIASWNVDKDGVDATLKRDGLMVDLQLKCTGSPTVRPTGYSHQLDTETYDKLRSRDRSAPGYLVLMIAPKDTSRWLTLKPDQLVLACHAYWARLQDRTKPARGRSLSITIPRCNVLDGSALAYMFDDSREMVRRPG